MKIENTMTRLTMFVAAALLSAISMTSALAQEAISEPGAFQAEFPDLDVLNGGALTPAGRMGLELPGGAVNLDAARHAYARMGGGDAGFAGPGESLSRKSHRR
jgi:hypothetical protein